MARAKRARKEAADEIAGTDAEIEKRKNYDPSSSSYDGYSSDSPGKEPEEHGGTKDGRDSEAEIAEERKHKRALLNL